jgi:ferredoxin/flavodoxin
MSGAKRAAPPVKGLVVYGTSRGSTAEVADAIVDGMKSAGADASSISLEYLKLMPDPIPNVDILGVGSPVYFLREVGYMTEYLTSLTGLEGKKAFVFCTSGMNRVGETLLRMSVHLRRRGAQVVGAEWFKTAMSYEPYRKRGLGNPENFQDGAQLQHARSFGAEMARLPEPQRLDIPPVHASSRIKARILASSGVRKMLFPQPRLDTAACTGYGSCLSRCPFNGLEREDGAEIPYFTDTCVQCLECLAWCPRSGIVLDSPLKDWLSTVAYRLRLH